MSEPASSAQVGASERDRASHRLWNLRRAIVALFVASGFFASWNIVDESYLAIFDQRGSVLHFTAAWLLWPALAMMAGLLSKDLGRARRCLVLSIMYLFIFASYAANGSTQDRPEGAQHMHLVLVPVLVLPILSLVALCAMDVATRAADLVQRAAAFAAARLSGRPS